MWRRKPTAPITLVLDNTFSAWDGDVTGQVCAITGEPGFFFDQYAGVVVGASASHKIQSFVRQREALQVEGPLTFRIYGRDVCIEDRRTRQVQHERIDADCAGAGTAVTDVPAEAWG